MGFVDAVKVLVTGAEGQVGTEVPSALSDHTVTAAGRRELDVTDEAAVREAVEALRPDAVVNCAAYNAVDRAEAEPGVAWRVNVDAVASLAAACRSTGSHLVHVSTDYVFDGEHDAPYVESDPPRPLSAYGRSKLEGEAAAQEAGSWAVVRTALVFGRIGRSLVEGILRRALAGERLRMVTDQYGSPTSAADLAAVLAQLAVRRATGLYHVVNAGVATPFELARTVLEVGGLDAHLEPMTLAELDRPAPRPRYSVLSSERLEAAGIAPLRHHRDALQAVVPRLIAASTTSATPGDRS